MEFQTERLYWKKGFSHCVYYWQNNIFYNAITLLPAEPQPDTILLTMVLNMEHIEWTSQPVFVRAIDYGAVLTFESDRIRCIAGHWMDGTFNLNPFESQSPVQSVSYLSVPVFLTGMGEIRELNIPQLDESWVARLTELVTNHHPLNYLRQLTQRPSVYNMGLIRQQVPSATEDQVIAAYTQANGDMVHTMMLLTMNVVSQTSGGIGINVSNIRTADIQTAMEEERGWLRTHIQTRNDERERRREERREVNEQIEQTENELREQERIENQLREQIAREQQERQNRREAERQERERQEARERRERERQEAERSALQQRERERRERESRPKQEAPAPDEVQAASYRALMAHLYGLPVELPPHLIINYLRVEFIPVERAKILQIERIVIDPVHQAWAGPPGTQNRILTLILKNGTLALVKARHNPETNEISPPS